MPEPVLRNIRDQATEGEHFTRNPSEGGRIEWTSAGVELVLQHADLATLKVALTLALKNPAPPQEAAPAAPEQVLVAIRRGINPVIVTCRRHGQPVGAAQVRCRVHPEVAIIPGHLLKARPVSGVADLFEIVGKPYRERV